jgi:phosphohistidine phosphatase SixA
MKASSAIQARESTKAAATAHAIAKAARLTKAALYQTALDPGREQRHVVALRPELPQLVAPGAPPLDRALRARRRGGLRTRPAAPGRGRLLSAPDPRYRATSGRRCAPGGGEKEMPAPPSRFLAALAGAAAACATLGAPALGADPAARQALKPRLEGRALIEALQKGGLTILMRHVSTDPVAPDPETFDVADCATQRNLSEKGREQARQIAEAIARLGIRISKADSSPYCRCLETARLAFGRVEVSEVLSVGDDLSFEEKHQRGRSVREMLATPPEPGTNAVLITHTGTLLYSFGLDARPEGIAHVFQPGPAGTAIYQGSLLAEDWPRLAAELAPAADGPEERRAPRASDAP